MDWPISSIRRVAQKSRTETSVNLSSELDSIKRGLTKSFVCDVGATPKVAFPLDRFVGFSSLRTDTASSAPSPFCANVCPVDSYWAKFFANKDAIRFTLEVDGQGRPAWAMAVSYLTQVANCRIATLGKIFLDLYRQPIQIIKECLHAGYFSN